MPKWVATALKRIGLFLGGVILLVSVLPYLFPGFVTEKLSNWANNHLRGKLVFSHATLSFFARFPDLTLTLYDVTLSGSAPFAQDTLVAAHEISFGVNLPSLLKQRIIIDKIFLADGQINVQVDQRGQASYNVYKSSTDSSSTASSDSSSAALTIEQILIERTNVVYNDRSVPLLIRAKNMAYEGKGDLSKAVFDLHTHTHIDSVDLYYDGQPYVLGKSVNADLVTNINTNSLALVFAKNDLRINRLPVQFRGRFAFLRDGYTLDFRARSVETDLHNITSALPPDLLRWANKTDIRGFGTFTASLVGSYVAATHTKPALQFNATLRNGYIAYPKAPAPARNVRLDLSAKLPNLDPEKLELVMDTLSFQIDKDFFRSRLRIKGFSQPNIHALVDTDIDLEKWDKAFGIPSVNVKGRYRLHLQADGDYATAMKQTSLRKTERVITSIPRFTLTSSLENGYLKYEAVPQPIQDIRFAVVAACPDQDYRHAHLTVDSLRAKALNNVISGFARFRNAKDIQIDAQVQALVHLAEVRQFYPLGDSIRLAGDLAVQARTQGQYIPAKRLFPVTKAQVRLTNGAVRTKYYPRPVERIQLIADVLSQTPSLRSLTVSLSPVSFWFEGQPFQLQAHLRNFDNLHYAITSRGTIDVGKLYRLVAQKGYDVTGTVKTNLSLRGDQRDAMARRYDRLDNRGTLQIRNLALSSELFPKPFFIRTGLFRFAQEKVWFDRFRTTYGSSTIDMNGYLTDVVSYATKPRAPLRGSFTLTSDAINVDEFMAFADKPASTKQAARKPALKSSSAGSSGASGVIIVPTNLAIEMKALAKQVSYNGLTLQNAQGQMRVDSGRITLRQTGFTLIGTPVVMNATYQSLSPKRARFDYHINAKDFDIKRAYREITLFRDLATSAAKAEGLVSLDYQLRGDLDANMKPVYPSLTGEGVLSVRKIKMKGFRLFGAVSNKTGHDINNPDLSEVDLKSTIANNTITIERTKLRVAGFRPRIEGKVSLDGKLDLNFRLGLPPFGIFGIPMTISGTQFSPKIHLGKGKEDKDEKDQ